MKKSIEAPIQSKTSSEIESRILKENDVGKQKEKPKKKVSMSKKDTSVLDWVRKFENNPKNDVTLSPISAHLEIPETDLRYTYHQKVYLPSKSILTIRKTAQRFL